MDVVQETAPTDAPEVVAPPPDSAALCARFRASPVRFRDLRSLHAWLSSIPAEAAFEEATEALQAGARWLAHGPRRIQGRDGRTVRLGILLEVLETVPAWLGAVAHAVATVVHETDAVSLFETGLPNDRGLTEETFDRLSRRLLPSPRNAHSLAELVGRLFPHKEDVEWLARMPDDLALRFAGAVHVSRAGDPWARARQGLLDAVSLVALRVSALGLSQEIRARSPEVALAASPFFILPRLCDALFSGVETGSAIREQIAACREVLEAVLKHLDEFGVSVDVVYRLEVIGKNLDRLVELLNLLGERGAADETRDVTALIARLASARLRDRSIADVVRTNVHLLARKMIERAGDSGGHYITATRREWWRMLASAGGGGVLTAATCAIKYMILWMPLAPFLEGLLASMNYAGSFLVMQLLGFTLATKQPSMTAAALAGALGARAGADGSVAPQAKLDDLVTMIARITRSQLAAAIGNVGLVIPAAIGFNFLHQSITGRPFLDAHGADHAISSLHPTHSGTILFAALTGVALWLSSMCAGWLENWVIYRRLPEGISQHRFGHVVGQRAMRWLGHKVARGAAGFGGNVSLGFLLGMVPIFGKFMGLPLEMRHITLSTGGLTLAACAVGTGHPDFNAAMIGIAIIGLLNFGVSFVLALALAMRARNAGGRNLRLAWAVLRRLARSPLEFLIPPKT